jgi:hypothetical protein
MSYYLIDFNSEINYDFDNIIIGNKIKIDEIRSKYYIYYQPDNDNPKEIFLKLPKIRLIYSLANQKYNQVKIPIYPNYDLTKNFIKFIQNLESDIKNCFIKKCPKLEYISLISSNNNLKFIKTDINKNIKITSDVGSKIELSDFKINGQIELVIKLSYIWNKSNIRFGLSSSLYQIKYYAPPEQLDINFIDPEPIIETPIPPPLPLMNKTPEAIISRSYVMASSNSAPLPQQIKVGIVPSISDLQKAIKNLKSKSNKLNE